MNTMNQLLTVTVMLGLVAATAPAAEIVWGGGDGEYTVGTNWVGGNVPNLTTGDTARIDDGNVTYTPGGDLFISPGTLRVSGGSFTQTDGVAWMQLGAGKIQVDGGSFDQGTAGNIVVGVGGTIEVSAGSATFTSFQSLTTNGIMNVSGGTVSFAGNYAPNTGSTFSLTGGEFTIDGEFQPQASGVSSVTGGTLKVNLIAFNGGDAVVPFSSGRIEVANNAWSGGIFGGGATKYIDFVGEATGVYFLNNAVAADVDPLINGIFRYNGVVDAGAFNVVETNDGVEIYVNEIPEPASMALLGLGATMMMVRRKRH